jgi:omega-hydroxy-beta-dihydromenaquinone-9 sulfotransferase
MYQRLEESKKLLDRGQYYELRYEDLTVDPVGELKKLYDHFGLGGFDACLPRLREYLASIKGYETNRYHLTDEQRAVITKRWGAVIDRYGYGQVS